MAKKISIGLPSILLLGIILIGLIVAVLMLGKGTGLRFGGAWDCTKYNFSMEQNGKVFVQNASSAPEPATEATIYINGVVISRLPVPATFANTSPTLIGTVAVPSNGVFTWRAVAKADARCDDSGSFTTAVQCNYFEIKVTQ